MTEYAYDAIEKGMKLYRERNPQVAVLPEVALIAMDVKTGEVKVLIGGKDFATSPYNRATQAKRQPGSAFKPIIYLTGPYPGVHAGDDAHGRACLLYGFGRPGLAAAELQQ